MFPDSKKQTGDKPTTLTGIEVFKDGTFKPMSGGGISFSKEDVRTVAINYSPTVFEAPIVVGHPKSDHPAYGWVSSLKVEGGKLLADADQVELQFAEMVKAGRFKKVSITLFSPRAQGNPTPGKYYLKHVGFLGAAAPAVPGLKPVSLSADDNETITLAGDISFSQGDELDAMARISELEAQLANKEAENFVEEMIDQGRILPCNKEGVISFMENLSGTEEFSFSEGGEIVKKPGTEWFENYIRSNPAIVCFSEISGGRSPFNSEISATSNLPKNYAVDQNSLELHNKALQFADANNCDYRTAVLAIEGKG